MSLYLTFSNILLMFVDVKQIVKKFKNIFLLITYAQC